MAVRPDLNRSHSRTRSQDKALRKSLEQSFELTALLEEKLQTKVTESEGLIKQLGERDREIKRLTSHLKDATKSIQELTHCNGEMHEQLTKVQADYQSLLVKYESTAKQLEQWELNGRALRDQAEQLTTISRQQQEQLREVTAQKTHLEASRDALQGKYEVALREIREMSNRPEVPLVHSRAPSRCLQTSELQTPMSVQPSLSSVLQPHNATLQKENSELHQKCTDLASQLAAVQNRMSSLKGHHRSRHQSVDYYAASRVKDGVQDYIAALSRTRK